MSKIDYAIAALIGFFTGIFAIPVLFNIGMRDPVLLLAAPWVGAAAGGAGMRILVLAASRRAVLGQFGIFGMVGLLNTAIDFGVLNLLSWASGVAGGIILGGVNLPGFGIAVVNSYFWNKFWVFKDRGDRPLFADFPKFFAVTVGGVLINSGIIIVLTTYVPPLGGVGRETWLNVAKAAATIVTLFWNFAGYKFVVFRPGTLRDGALSS